MKQVIKETFYLRVHVNKAERKSMENNMFLCINSPKHKSMKLGDRSKITYNENSVSKIFLNRRDVKYILD